MTVVFFYLLQEKLPFQVTGNAEQDYMNMLMASPLFQQINDIHDMLEKSSMDQSGKSDKILGNVSKNVVIKCIKLPDHVRVNYDGVFNNYVRSFGGFRGT